VLVYLVEREREREYYNMVMNPTIRIGIIGVGREEEV
jgi:hypothetical protein